MAYNFNGSIYDASNPDDYYPGMGDYNGEAPYGGYNSPQATVQAPAVSPSDIANAAKTHAEQQQVAQVVQTQQNVPAPDYNDNKYARFAMQLKQQQAQNGVALPFTAPTKLSTIEDMAFSALGAYAVMKLLGAHSNQSWGIGLVAALHAMDSDNQMADRYGAIQGMLKQGYSYGAVMDWYRTGNMKNIEAENKDLQANKREEMKEKADLNLANVNNKSAEKIADAKNKAELQAAQISAGASEHNADVSAAASRYAADRQLEAAGLKAQGKAGTPQPLYDKNGNPVVGQNGQQLNLNDYDAISTAGNVKPENTSLTGAAGTLNRSGAGSTLNAWVGNMFGSADTEDQRQQVEAGNHLNQMAVQKSIQRAKANGQVGIDRDSEVERLSKAGYQLDYSTPERLHDSTNNTLWYITDGKAGYPVSQNNANNMTGSAPITQEQKKQVSEQAKRNSAAWN